MRPGEDPSVKSSREELTRGVVITYVDDLPFTGFQCHINALTKALLAKYVMKQSGTLPVGTPGMERIEGMRGLLETVMVPFGVTSRSISCTA